jgi:hypothetical protein
MCLGKGSPGDSKQGGLRQTMGYFCHLKFEIASFLHADPLRAYELLLILLG